ncbi:hypothetical protein FNF27_00950 [Cafeteria roenbergensis]|uniref:Cdc23 domain-containing protein n=1 Tax=Cafeteria roenbergensis TaxID=33653 RepID=A0A5A8EJJ2_CAFRO|nr:hypothetical protein FNF27_00950 [Cafeteria roenbergensis]
MEVQLAGLVEYYLSCHLHESASFLCERLFSLRSSESNRHLLACCYIYSGKRGQAIQLLREARSPVNRYLLARYLLEDGDPVGAEEALLAETPFRSLSLADAMPHLRRGLKSVPNNTAGLFLWASILDRQGRADDACRLYRMVLEVDPFQVAAFARLCELGKAPRAEQVFKLPDTLSAIAAAFEGAGGGAEPVAAASAAEEAAAVLAETGGTGTHGGLGRALERVGAPLPGEAAHPAIASAGDVGRPATGPLVASMAAARAAAAALAPLMGTADRAGHEYQPAGHHGGAAATPTARPSITEAAVAAASAFDGRHSPSPASRAVSKGYGAAASQPAHAPAAGSGVAEDDASLVPIAAAEAGVAAACGSQLLGLSQTLGMLSALGTVLWWQAQHRGDRVQLALSELQTPSLRASAWAHGQAGLAHFESGHYNKAAASFALMRSCAPYSLEHCDILSTTLWHLKKHADLLLLAQELRKIDDGASQTWIASGNLFSLRGDHTTALRHFEHAITANDRAFYARTLAGYEHAQCGDEERAVACFRQAVAQNPRHFTAWAGLGMSFLRQQALAEAVDSFGQAVELNSRSAVLRSFFGIALHAIGRVDEAIAQLERARVLDPSNPQPTFQLARLMEERGDLRAAVRFLEAARRRAPTEFSVHFALGRVKVLLGKIVEAAGHFETASHVCPAKANTVQAALVRLQDGEPPEESLY